MSSQDIDPIKKQELIRSINRKIRLRQKPVTENAKVSEADPAKVRKTGAFPVEEDTIAENGNHHYNIPTHHPTENVAGNTSKKLNESEYSVLDNNRNGSKKTGDSIQIYENTPFHQSKEIISIESKCYSMDSRTSENEMTKEVEKLKKKNLLLAAENEDLELNVSKKEEIEEKLKLKLENAENKMKEMMKEMEELKKNNTQLSMENEDLKLKNSKRDETEEKLRSTLNTAEAMVKTTEKDVEKYKENEETQRKESENMKEMIRTLEEKLIYVKKAAEKEQINNTVNRSFFENQLFEKDRIIDELQQKILSSELSDADCLICLDSMETMKCKNCRRRFHVECASKWLEVKRMCPACSSKDF